jgi:molybdate transport repressor ModE-like protein
MANCDSFSGMLDPTQLRYFVAIAKHGSITQAAKEIGASQPTLTVALKSLEEQLETTLFFRERTGVRLTSTGDELLKLTQELFELMDRGEARIRGLEREDRGTFVIGCHESLGSYVLPSFMQAFLKDNPGIDLRLHNATSEETVAAVLGRDVTFGLVVNPHPHPDLVLVELFRDTLDILTSAANVPLADDSEAALRAAMDLLRAGPLIYVERIEQCQDLMNQLAAEGLLPTRKLACGDLELVKSLALAGVGPALLPRRVARYGHFGQLVRLHTSLPAIADTIFLVYRADMHKTKAALRVKDALVKHGRSLEGAPSMTTRADT